VTVLPHRAFRITSFSTSFFVHPHLRAAASSQSVKGFSSLMGMVFQLGFSLSIVFFIWFLMQRNPPPAAFQPGRKNGPTPPTAGNFVFVVFLLLGGVEAAWVGLCADREGWQGFSLACATFVLLTDAQDL
jgi:hypothetical protein